MIWTNEWTIGLGVRLQCHCHCHQMRWIQITFSYLFDSFESDFTNWKVQLYSKVCKQWRDSCLKNHLFELNFISRTSWRNVNRIEYVLTNTQKYRFNFTSFSIHWESVVRFPLMLALIYGFNPLDWHQEQMVKVNNFPNFHFLLMENYFLAHFPMKIMINNNLLIHYNYYRAPHIMKTNINQH